MHRSVGAIIRNGKGEILMMDRKNPPFGWACPAGHVNLGEKAEQALRREVKEETGLDVLEFKQLFHEYLPWNECKQGVKGHDWFVYEILAFEGDPKTDESEAKRMKWVKVEELGSIELEQAWKKWLERIRII